MFVSSKHFFILKVSSSSILDFVDFQDFDIYETNPECQFILDMNSDDI